jgi:phosphate starvation-inducible PhoH-like protein
MNNYIKLLESPKPSIVVVTGPSGTGKTMQACKVGQKCLYGGMYDRILLTRPAVTPGGESHGYIPGDLSEKMDPWVRPSLEYFGPHQKRMEVCPLAFMRGRTFEKSWIVADEMQNSTKDQMLMLLTRIGFGSKLVIIGDPDQTDLEDKTYTGLDDLLNRLVVSDEIAHVQLRDVYRSPVVKEILRMYKNSHD